MTDSSQQILLNIQKQIGELSRETGVQSEMLKNIHQEVKYTNGRVTKLETVIIPAISDQVGKNGRFINDWKVRIGMIVTGVSVTWLIIGSWVKGKLGL